MRYVALILLKLGDSSERSAPRRRQRQALPRGLVDEAAQAVVVLVTGRAALEMGAHPGKRGVGGPPRSSRSTYSSSSSKQASQRSSAAAGPSSRSEWSICERHRIVSGSESSESTLRRRAAGAASAARRAGSCRARRASCPAARPARRSARRRGRARREPRAGAAKDELDRALDRRHQLRCSTRLIGPEAGARDEIPGLRLEQHLALLPGAPAQLTPASKSANLYAQVVKRLSPRKSSRRRERDQRVVGGLQSDVVELPAAEVGQRACRRQTSKRRPEQQRVKPPIASSRACPRRGGPRPFPGCRTERSLAGSRGGPSA